VGKLRESTGHFTKNLGDGYMQIIEIPNVKSTKKALQVLRAHLRFGKNVQKLIDTSPWPRPHGFRIRFSAGHVWKKDGAETDYVGRYINMTHKLLMVHPEVKYVSHQSFVELMSKNALKKHGKFVRLPSDRRIPEGILKTDISALWKFVVA